LAIFSIACDGFVRARGVVQTPEAIPIPDAVVVLASPKGFTFTGKTNATGCFDVFGVTAPGRYRYSLIAVAPNRKPLATAVRTGMRGAFVMVTLASESAREDSVANVRESSAETSGAAGNACEHE
jgi:hypothetical protein